jgi:hypothetical protein
MPPVPIPDGWTNGPYPPPATTRLTPNAGIVKFKIYGPGPNNQKVGKGELQWVGLGLKVTIEADEGFDFCINRVENCFRYWTDIDLYVGNKKYFEKPPGTQVVDPDMLPIQYERDTLDLTIVLLNRDLKLLIPDFDVNKEWWFYLHVKTNVVKNNG